MTSEYSTAATKAHSLVLLVLPYTHLYSDTHSWLPKLQPRPLPEAQAIADEEETKDAEEVEVDAKAAPNRTPKHLFRKRRRTLTSQTPGRTLERQRLSLRQMILLFVGSVPNPSSITPYLSVITVHAMYAV